MKRFIILTIVCFICLLTSCEGENTDSKFSSAATKEEQIEAASNVETPEITAEPTKETTLAPSPTPEEPSEKISLYDALPQPTPVYEPTEEDLAFKQQIISEGKTLAFDMTEWELIDIMCNKLGRDEYLYRLINFEEYPDELYLIWTRNVPEGLNVIPIILNTINGDLFYRDEANKEYIVGNIFTSEDKEEPFRLSDYNQKWLIEQFAKNILHGNLSDDVKVQVAYDGAYDMYFTTFKIVDGKKEYIEDYFLVEDTGEVYKDFSEYVGILFD